MDLLTAAQAATRYRERTGRRMGAVRMRQLAQRGQIPASKPGREWLYRAADVDAFAAQDRPNLPPASSTNAPHPRATINQEG